MRKLSRRVLGDRLGKFSLELAIEKTRCIEFGRCARENAWKRGQKPEEFTFLGFTHYCGKTKRGYFKVKRRIGRKNFGQSIREFTDWARLSRKVLKKGEMLRMAKAKVMGHLIDKARPCSLTFSRQIIFQLLAVIGFLTFLF